MSGPIAPRGQFLLQFLRNPRELGSITPSSRYLTGAVVGAIDFSRAARIVELGPGTGVFTRALLDRLPPDGELLGIESNARFVEGLRRDLPDPRLTVVRESAEHVERLVGDLDWDHVDAVVSGIPYTLLPKPLTVAILRASERTLRPGGLFVGYQYSRYLRPALRMVFGNVHYRRVWRNVPPAFVYASRKQEDAGRERGAAR